MFLLNNFQCILLRLSPFYTAFLHSIKLSGHRIGIKLDKDTLAVEKNNYATKILNVYIDFDLDTQPRNHTKIILTTSDLKITCLV